MTRRPAFGTRTGEELPQSPLKGDGGEVWAAVFSPDGKWILTGGMGQTAQLWDADTGRPVGEPLMLHQGIFAAAFSPDGATFLTADTSGKVAFWQTKTGRPVGRPLKHPGAVRSAAFRPDGKAVLTGCDEGFVRLWQTATGKAVGPAVRSDKPIMAVAFSPDGRTLRMSDGREVRSMDAPTAVQGEADRIRLWVQVMTGAERDADGVIRTLDVPTWQERRRRLDESPGPALP